MKHPLLLFVGLLATGAVVAQCKIVIDKTDPFDSVRLIAAQPVVLGYLVPTGNASENLKGRQTVEEAKAIFSFSNEKNIRSFFLTLGVVERKFHLIEPDYNVWLLFDDGQIVKLLNVPDEGEFDRNILLWKYMHTCVIPLEIFHQMKNQKITRIRIDYTDYKQTLELEEKQQIALQNAVKCVEERLIRSTIAKP